MSVSKGEIPLRKKCVMLYPSTDGSISSSASWAGARIGSVSGWEHVGGSADDRGDD